MNVTKGFPYSTYNTSLKLNEQEIDIANKIINIIKGKKVYGLEEIDISKISDLIQTQDLLNVFPDKERYNRLTQDLEEILKKYGINNNEMIGYIIDKTFGFNKIGPLLRDNELEEIMINGSKKNVFVWHKKYGMCKTNIVYEDNELLSFISKIAKTVGRVFDLENPLLDARLSDGSRVNATYDLVTPFGSTLTIRKFESNPISITRLIQNNTINSELAAFLWLCVEGFNISPLNILVIGGTGSGKTTLLMSLTSFIRYSDRIITIEDTPEINLQDRDNWIQMESRPKTAKSPEINMNDLLKNSLRMRPDRIIVGEVRGNEAQTLFIAMDTGHNGILGTLHANTPKESIIRLKNSPMDVPESNIPLLDLIVNIKKYYVQNQGLIRSVCEVAELERMENSVLISNIFERKINDKEIKRTNIPMKTIEKLAEIAGGNKQDIVDELEIRKHMLEYLTKNEIFDYIDITKFVQRYYEDPQGVIDTIFRK